MSSARTPAPKSIVTRELLLLLLGSALLGVGVIFAPAIAASRYPWMSGVVFGAAYLVVGGNVLAAAFRGIVRGRVFNENLLMTIATVGAFIIHQRSEAVAVMVFYKVGELLQHLSVERSRRSIGALLSLRPSSARVMRDGHHVEVRPEDVRVGEQIMVRPGERIPLDGVVTAGAGFVDTSALTGESVPRRVVAGREMLAGFISTDGSIEMNVSRAAANSGAARIAKMVEGAAGQKARTERFIARFARRYTPAVVVAAALVAFLPPLFLPGAMLSTWVYRALTMLVIACPCALVISIPLGYFGGVGGASRHGILVKGAAYLDALSNVRTMVFDKTGTLTQGSFRVTSMQPRNGVSGPDLLRYAALAEAHSNHPIAASIRLAYGKAVDGNLSAVYRELGGEGVMATVDGRSILAGNDRLMHANSVVHDTCTVEGTAVHCAVDGRYAGYLVIGDELRPGAKEAIRGLRALGVTHTALLTGDDGAVARRTADELGIDELYGDLLPGEKVTRLEGIMRARPGRTAFVGDGINDAPVLARADVGIALGKSASDAAVETADVVLMSDNPAKVLEAITRARATRAIIIQNIVFALGVKGIFLGLGAFGVATMWEAVIADMGVALVAILNATRAMR